MAYLDRQRESFASNLASAAAKINVKRPAAPVSPSPSIASTASATASSTPVKKKAGSAAAATSATSNSNNNMATANGAIYSQPENTGVGSAIGTNIVYALDYLKQQGGQAVSLHAVLGHLNLDREPEGFKRKVVERMRQHPRITWQPGTSVQNGEDDLYAGTYEHKPVIPHVKDRTALLQYLQRRTDAQGVTVKDLKDGWPDCEATLTALEREHRILVLRTKKDNHPRMVWLDDPTLCHAVEPEFQALWHRVELPPLEDIVRKLSAAGQKPTSEDPRLRDMAAPREKKQKKRAQRRTGKSTNTHMEHLLKDYSYMKR